MERDVLGFRKQPTDPIEDRARMVESYLDMRRGCGVAYRDPHLFARVDERGFDNFGRDGIGRARTGLAHFAFFMRRLPYSSTAARHARATSVHESYCSTSAGPVKRLPTRSAVREKTGVAIRPRPS